MDLTEFVAARLGEKDSGANDMHVGTCGSTDRDGEYSSDPVWCGCDGPERARREVAAGRAIIARYVDDPKNLGEQLQRHQERLGLYFALHELAAIDSGHPDYDQDWRPL
ncbi:MAG TPA: DUF6221 family protein [Streptosporangiaceae bacterium]|nr:DUF6221 family protein [Streptosporangiaceae bacterium]